MILVSKTVAEWLLEKKLLEKRIESTAKSLYYNDKPFIITLESSKGSYDEKEFNKKILAKKQSLDDLNQNLEKIHNAILVYNANTEIEVCGRTMSVAYALSKYNGGKPYHYDLLRRASNDFMEAHEKAIANSEKVKATIVSGMGDTTSATDFMSQLNAIHAVKIIDPLKIVENANKEMSEIDDFYSIVNSKINIKNATTTIEIELK